MIKIKMGLFSCFKKDNTLRCDWCGKEMQEASYTKYNGNKKFSFCSDSCKQSFKKLGRGKSNYKRCPTCPMAPKSWD